MRVAFRLFLAIAAAGMPPAAQAQDNPPAYQVPRSEVRLITAQSGAQYRIMIARPEAPPPPAGYPVLYVLDGDEYFAIAAETARRLGRFARGSGVAPGIVIGIGYPGETRRSLDYTPPPRPGAPPAPRGEPSGGADAFLAFLAGELKPAMSRALPVDPARQSIMGHSFGGLFVLHALFSRSDLFQTWIAASPSIWFGDGAVLAREARLAERLGQGGLRPDLVLSVGEFEQSAPPWMAPGPRATEVGARNAERRMVDNARALAGRLEALRAQGLTLHFRTFSGETHGSAPLPAIGDAITHAFAEPGR